MSVEDQQQQIEFLKQSIADVRVAIENQKSLIAKVESLHKVRVDKITDPGTGIHNITFGDRQNPASGLN